MTSINIRSTALAVAMLGFALPAAAQDALCAGAGTGGQWVGGSEAASDITTSADFQEQMALVMGGNAFVTLFSVSAPTDVRVEAQGRGAGDPLIELLDASGNIILSDDDSGGAGASRGEMMLDAGTYCLSTQSYDNAPMTAFVRVGRTEQEALTEGVMTDETVPDNVDEPDMPMGSCADAPMIGGIGSSTEASADSTPYWRFALDAPSAITIKAVNETADPYITLYDANENYLDENDDYDGLNSQLDMTDPLPAGDYCIGVEALSDTAAPITISISAYDPAAALMDLYARGEASPPLDGTVPVTDLGTLTSRLRQDAPLTDDVTWYTIDIDEAGLLLVEAIGAGTSVDPWLVLYDDLGRQLAQNDDYGNGLDSLVTTRVTPGKYVVGVKQISDGAAGIIRMVFERYVPAK